MAAGKFLKELISKIKPLINYAAPIAGGALGTFLGGPAGGGAGVALGSTLANLIPG